MSFHDAYARITPVEVAFPDAEAASELFESITRGAEAAGADVRDLSAFMQIRPVGDALRELRAPEVGGEAVHRYAVLLHQSVLFHRAGGLVVLPSTGVIRYLIDGAPAVEDLALPGPAGYLQLPRHLFWAAGAGEHHESVDGMFWSLDEGGVLNLLLAQGLVDGRPGLSVVPVAEAPWDDAAQWLDAPMREGDSDFATTLPGGELGGLYSFVSAGEPLKFFARVCAYLAVFPDAVEDVENAEAPGIGRMARPSSAEAARSGSLDPETNGPPPSRYRYRRLILESR